MITRQDVRNAALRYVAKRAYIEDGQKFEMEVTVSLDDDCGNGCFDFSVTADIMRVAKNGKRVYYAGGCCHEEIYKHYKKLRPFIEMHTRNREGMPMHPFDDGYYFLKQGDTQTLMKKWWLTEEDGEIMAKLFNAPDQDMFTYLLYNLGLVDRAKEKAEKAIKVLEELTGKKWVNPYSPEEERLYKAPEELLEKVRQRISNGYYTEEAIEQRTQEEKDRKLAEEREGVIEDARKATEKIRVERDIMLFLLDAGFPIDNVIYYHHTKRVVFNWKDYGSYPKITWDDLDRLMAYPDAEYRIPAYTVFTLSEAYQKKVDRGIVIMGDGFESCWVGEPLPYPSNSHNLMRQIHQDKK